MNRLTLRESWKSVRFALWDEEQGRLVSFRDAATSSRRAAAVASMKHPRAPAAHHQLAEAYRVRALSLATNDAVERRSL